MTYEELLKENRTLRGLIQVNKNWKCPYGYNQRNNMGFCPLGFPGCACADDRLAVLCEDDERITEHLIKQVQVLARARERWPAAIAAVEEELNRRAP